MLEVGTKAPEFTLPDQNGEMKSLADYRGQKVIQAYDVWKEKKNYGKVSMGGRAHHIPDRRAGCDRESLRQGQGGGQSGADAGSAGRGIRNIISPAGKIRDELTSITHFTGREDPGRTDEYVSGEHTACNACISFGTSGTG